MPEALAVWVAGGLALVLTVLFGLARLRHNALSAIPSAAGSRAAEPDCMVVIPARNEEALIGRAVSSLPHDTVIVVDDHSTDGTAAVAERAGAGVLAAPGLPRNGLGKPNACAFGASALTSRWVLFTDADTWFEPGFLKAAVGYAELNGLALLSIYLDAECQGFAEDALVPYLRALAFAGFDFVNPRGLFRGQCLLADRTAYNFIGGHGAVVTQAVEDLKLLQAAERHRLKFGVVRAPGLGHVRLYRGYRGIVAGFKRQVLRFTLLSPMVGVTALAAALTALAWLPLLAWLAAERQWIAAVLLAILPLALLAPWYPRKANAVLAPVAIYACLPTLIAGFFSAYLGRSIEWKGRRVGAVS